VVYEENRRRPPPTLEGKRASGSSFSSLRETIEARHPIVEVTMNGLEEVRKLLEEGNVDVPRTMVKQMAEALTEPKPTPSVAPRAASATLCAPTAATAIAAVPGTRAPARSSWRCPACVAAAT
jgi:hypothetical protein